MVQANASACCIYLFSGEAEKRFALVAIGVAMNDESPDARELTICSNGENVTASKTRLLLIIKRRDRLLSK